MRLQRSHGSYFYNKPMLLLISLCNNNNVLRTPLISLSHTHTHTHTHTHNRHTHTHAHTISLSPLALFLRQFSEFQLSDRHAAYIQVTLHAHTVLPATYSVQMFSSSGQLALHLLTANRPHFPGLTDFAASATDGAPSSPPWFQLATPSLYLQRLSVFAT